MPSNQERRKAAKRRLERQLARRAEQARRRRAITVVATVIVVVAVVVAVFYFTQTGQPSATPAGQQQAAPTSGPCGYAPNPAQPAARPVGLPPDPNPTPAQGTVHLTFKTNQGDVPITLDRAEAPCTVQSFVHLAQAKFFDNTDCPRIDTDNALKMLQCGDPTGSGSGGPGYQFKDEIKPNQTYPRGTLAMANSGPNTNGSQFFMVFGDSQLPPQYTVFGSIDPAGLQVLDKVAQAGSDNSNPAGGGKPNTPVHINQAVLAQ